MLLSLRGSKDDMLKRRYDLQATYDHTQDDKEREAKKIEIRKIDQTLQTEYYKILEENGDDLPARENAKATVPSIQLEKEDLDQINEDHQSNLREHENWKSEVRKNFKEDQKEFEEEEMLAQERLR